jgi:trigger factor
MQTQENAGASALERRFDISIAKADIDKEVQQRLHNLSGKVKMAGFRPGKVPMNLIVQQYGPQTRSEALGAALEQAFGEQVRSRSLRVAGYPRIEEKATANADHLEFTAIFEVYPEIELGDVSGTTIEQAVFVVSDAEVDKTIEALRKQRVTYATVDRPSTRNDRLTIDFTGRKNGEEFAGGKAVDFLMVLGSGMMLPDFEAALAGVKAGERKTFTMNFPADYQVAELAGQEAQFEVVVKKVEEPKLPDLDADFARALGVKDGDLAQMRKEIRNNLEHEVKKRLQARVKNQVMDGLLTVNNIEVPKTLIAMESEQMAEHARKDMQARGANLKSTPVEASWFTDQAVRRVKLGLVLLELVKTKSLKAKPEQIKAMVEEYAQTFEEPKEVVRWYYSDPQRLAEAEALVTENNVVEWMLANAQVTEKPVAFDELMGNAA